MLKVMGSKHEVDEEQEKSLVPAEPEIDLRTGIDMSGYQKATPEEEENTADLGIDTSKYKKKPMSEENLAAIWQGQALFDSYHDSINADPDNEARIQNTEAKTGLPRWYIEKNPDKADKLANAEEEPDFNAIARDYPTLTKYLMDPLYMAMAKDDIPSLTGIEASLRKPNVFDTFSIAPLKEGTKDVARNMAEFIDLAADWMKRTEEKQLEFMDEDQRKAYLQKRQKVEDTPFLGKLQTTSDEWQSFADRLLKAKTIQADPDYVRPEGLKGYFQDVVRMAPQIGSQIAAAIFGGPITSMAFMGAQIAGGDYGNLKAEGVDDGRAMTAALSDAAMQTPLEMIGLSKFMKMIGGHKPAAILMKQIAEVMGTEFVTEWVQKYPEAATEIWAKTEGAPMRERAEMFLEDFGQTTMEGIYEGLVAAPFGLFGGAGKIVSEYAYAKRAEASRSAVEELEKAVTESKLTQRSPEKMKELIKGMGRESGRTHVFWPARAFDTLYQENADAKAEEIGISYEQLQEARATDGDIEIPVEQFAMNVLATEDGALVKDDIKFAPEEMTANEAKRYQEEELPRRVEEELRRSQEIVAREEAEAKEVKYVEDVVKNQQIASGIDAETAQTNATVFASGIRAFAKRMGKTPRELFDEMNFQVTDTDITQMNGITYGQDGTIELNDNFYKWFGDSKVVDEEGKPLVVYHGTRHAFETFDFSNVRDSGTTEGVGFYFSNNRAIAENYAREKGESGIMEVFLDIKKPMTVDQKKITKNQLRKIFKELVKIDPEALANYGDYTFYGMNKVLNDAVETEYQYNDTDIDMIGSIGNGGVADFETLNRVVKQVTGYDGVVVEWPHANAKVYVAFTPEQIKSVNNQGTWNPDDANIYHQPAYHGSPHRFDKFTIDHIGTGEGAQAYGWGLYFAGSKEVAKYYKEALSDWQPNGIQPEPGSVADKASAYVAVEIFNRSDVPYNAAIRKAKANGDTDVVEQIREWKETGVEFKKAGQLYEVDIPNDDVLLDWDKPLGEQSEEVKAILDNYKTVVDRKALQDQIFKEYDNNEITRQERNNRLENIPIVLKDSDTGFSIYNKLSAGTDEARSKYLNSLGIKGIKYLDGNSRAYQVILSVKGEEYSRSSFGTRSDAENYSEAKRKEGFAVEIKQEGSYNYVIFDDEAIQILNTYYQENRGQISFFSDKTVVSLFESADRSTFMHETGHMFFKMLENYANGKNAPQDIIDDWNTVRDYLNLDEGETLTREHAETLARTFEAYLMEGEAPSTRLQKVFQAFKKWLTEIYRSVAKLDVEVSDEIKGVMDRMVATEEEINAIEERAGFTEAMESLEGQGLADEDFYKERKKAREATEERLLKRKMRPYTEDGKDIIANEKKRAKERIEEEVAIDPRFQTLEMLRKPVKDGGLKLNKGMLVEEYGEEFVKTLPRGIYSTEGKFHVDEVVDILGVGYLSGHELLLDMQGIRTAKQEVEARLKEHMEKFTEALGNLTEEMAERSITTEEWLDVLLKQYHRLLQEDKRQQKRDLLKHMGAVKQAARDAAKTVLENKKVRDIRPRQYLAAMQRLSRNYAQALRDGDFLSAREFLEQQIFNHALAMEAFRVQGRNNGSLKFLKKMSKQKTKTSSINIEYLLQIQNLLSEFNFRKISDKKAAEIDSRKEFMQRELEAGEMIHIPDKLIEEAYKVDHRQMTVTQLEELRTTVEHLAHLGRTKQGLLDAQGNRLLDKEKEVLLKTADEMNKRKHKTSRDPNEKFLDKALHYPRWMHASMLTIETMLQKMDGWKVMGPWHQAIYGKLRLSANMELAMQGEAYHRLKEIFAPYERGELGKKVYIRELDMSFTRNHLLSFLLNMGNEEGYSRLLETWTEEELDIIKDYLTEKDVQTAKALWALCEEYFDPANDTLKRVAKLEMQKVRNRQVDTKFGTLDGGYYHIKYDPNKNEKVKTQEEEAMLVPQKHYFVGGAPKRGFTKSRAKKVTGKQVLLDVPSVLGGHLTEVIHFVSFAENSREVRRLLSDDDVRLAIKEILGKEQMREIDNWIKDVVFGEEPRRGFMDNLLHRGRINTTFAMLGGNLTVALLQTTSYPAAAEYIGPHHAAMGLIEFYGNPVNIPEKIKFVFDNSIEMKTRSMTFHRDINEAIGSAFTKSTKKDLQKAAFLPTTTMDYAATLAIWMKSFNLELKKTKDHDKAVKYADFVVRNTQPAGHIMDRAGIQRGAELNKIVSMFYTWMSKVYQLTYRSGSRSVKAAMNGNMKFLPILANTAICTWFFPAVGYALLHGDRPEDNDDTWMWWAIKRTAAYPLQSVVLVREIASFYDPQLTPVESIAKAAQRLIFEMGDVMEGDIDLWDISERVIETAGYTFGLPSRMALVPLEHMQDFLEYGEDFNAMSLLFRKYE